VTMIQSRSLDINLEMVDTPQAESNPPSQNEQDAPWKRVLRQYFREATEFFFPDIEKVVDWTRPIEFLDKEFMKIAPDAVTGKRFADQLVKVYRKQGQPIFLLIHVEIQGARESGFGQRIFTKKLGLKPPPF
jgi:hypothetical protein